MKKKNNMSDICAALTGIIVGAIILSAVMIPTKKVSIPAEVYASEPTEFILDCIGYQSLYNTTGSYIDLKGIDKGDKVFGNAFLLKDRETGQEIVILTDGRDHVVFAYERIDK